MRANRSARILFSFAAAGLVAIQAAAIMSPDERRQAIERAAHLLESERLAVSEEALANLTNPFSPERAKPKIEGREAPRAVEDPTELLATLSRYVRPTGIFAVRDERYIMIGESSFRENSTIPIIHNNQEYRLTVIQVSRTSFTLGFGGEELQIKLN